MTLAPVKPRVPWWQYLQPAAPNDLTPPPISSVREPSNLFVPTARLDPWQVEDRRGLPPDWGPQQGDPIPPGPVPAPTNNDTWQTFRGLEPHISPPNTGDAGLTAMAPRTALDPVSPETPAAPAFTPTPYDPNVEQWRSRIEARMPASLRNRPDAEKLVDKALWVMKGESGGDPTIPDQSGKSTSYGLFQDLDGKKAGGPDGQIDQMWGKVSKNPDNWTDWNQEGNTYDPGDGSKPFVWGSLGVNPYPGDVGSNLAEHLSTGATSFPASAVRALRPVGAPAPHEPTDYGQIAAGEAGQLVPYADQSATTGVDAPVGTLRARLEAERQGESQYGGLPARASAALESVRGSSSIPVVTPALEAVAGQAGDTLGGATRAGTRAALSLATGGPLADALSGDLPIVGGPDLTKNVPVLGDALEKRKAIIHGASDAAGNVIGGLAEGAVPTTGLDLALAAPELALKAPELALALPGAVGRAGRAGLRAGRAGLEKAALRGLEEDALARAPSQAGIRTVAKQGGMEVPVRGAGDLLPVGGGAMSGEDMYLKAKALGMTDAEIESNFPGAVAAGRGIDVAAQREAGLVAQNEAAAHAAKRVYTNVVDQTGDLEQAAQAAKQAAAKATEAIAAKARPNVLADDDVAAQMAAASQRMRAEAASSSPLDAEPYVPEPGSIGAKKKPYGADWTPEERAAAQDRMYNPDAPLKPGQVKTTGEEMLAKADASRAERQAAREEAAKDNPLLGLIDDVRDGLRRTKPKTILEAPANAPEAAALDETAGRTFLPSNLPAEAAGPLGLKVEGAAVNPNAPKPYKFNPVTELLGLLGALRTGPASLDIGNVGRQGAVGGARHPGIWKDMLEATVKAYGSQAYADAEMARMEADPVWKLLTGTQDESLQALADARYRRGGGVAAVPAELPDVGSAMKVYGEGSSLAAGATRVPGFEGMNPSYISQAARKLMPWLTANERGLATGMNVEGYKIAKKWLEPMLQAGMDSPEDLAHYRALTNVINHGRGYSGAKLADIVGSMQALYSAQYTFSRFNVLADPFVYWQYPEARKLATQNLLAFVGQNVAMMGFLGASGAVTGKWSVNADPRSSDFGQLRVGNTRIDTLAGFGPLVKTIAKIGAHATDAAGITNGASDDVKEVNDLLKSFIENKESPVAKIVSDYLLHNGKLPNLKDPKADLQMVTPMLAWDIVDSITENKGWNKVLGIPTAALSALGEGTSTYSMPADHADQVSQETYGGKKYEALAPLERLTVLDKLPEKGSDGFAVQAPARTAERKSMDQALEKAGYAKAPKDSFETDDQTAARTAANAEILRKNPELAVQSWYFSHPPVTKGTETKPGGGALPTAAAVDAALKLQLPNREVKLAGADRVVNADPDSQRFWQKYGADVEYYLHDIVSDKPTLDQVAQWKAAQSDGEKYRDPKTKKPLSYDQLPGSLQTAVKGVIRDAATAKDPNLEAVLAFMGVGGSSDKGVKTYTLGSKAAAAEYQKLQAEFPQAKDLGNIVTARNAK